MTIGQNKTLKCTTIYIIGILLLSLAGCSGVPKLSSLNPFEKKENKLPGTRIAVIGAQGGASGLSTTASKPSIPAAVVNSSWSQPGGAPSNSLGNLSFNGSLKTIWSSDSGEGSSSDGHLTSSPLVLNGKIYTLDAEGQIRSFSSGSGKQIWKVSTTPENEDESEGYGGGLAFNQGRLFAATGYGNVVALNPANGKILWTKKLGVPVRSSPTAAQDRVFVVTTEGKLFCLSAVDGAELWTFRGLPENASLLSNTSPAISGNIAVVPFASGELGAYKVSDGKPVWSESLVRRRRGTTLSAFNTVSSPSVSGDLVFAVSHSGKMIAAKKNSGERIWTQNIASNQKPYAAGNTVFIINTSGSLLALSTTDGKARWTRDLPKSGTWSGPVLAGSRLWAVSSKGLVVGVNALTGQIDKQRDLDTRVYIPPIVAQNKMYIYTDRARLIALN